MEAKCPHCGKSIELVGASELASEYGMNANRLQHARSREEFPEPWLTFGNRYEYLRSEVEEYMAKRAQKNVGKTANALQRILDSLPPDEAKKALEALREPSGGK